MSQGNIEKRTESLLEPIINELGYEIYDVQYVKEAKDYFLRITIDKEAGINIDDCEKVNRAIDDILDEADIIKESYFLEVSSPGIERVLRKPKHFEKQLGNEIVVKLFKAINKQKEIQGVLTKYSAEELELQVEDEIIKIDLKNIALARVFANI